VGISGISKDPFARAKRLLPECSDHDEPRADHIARLLVWLAIIAAWRLVQKPNLAATKEPDLSKLG
jgi:hypothetical protein